MTKKVRLRVGLCLTLIGLSMLCASPSARAQNCSGLATLDCNVPAQRHTVCGCWENVITPWPSEAIHAALVPTGTYPNITGKVLTFDRGIFANRTTTVPATLWDPQCGTSAPNCFQPVPLVLPNTNATIFCAGHSFLSDGKLLVTGGGYVRSQEDARGHQLNFWFNPFAAGTAADPWWKPRADLNDRTCQTPTCPEAVDGGRYYPTNISMDLPGYPDTVLTVSGTNKTALSCTPTLNDTVERYDRRETRDNPTGKWDIISTNIPTDNPKLPLTYPRLFVFPSPDRSIFPTGLIFHAGGEQQSHLYSPIHNVWSEAAPARCPRADGTYALLPLRLDYTGDISYADVRVLSAGGANPQGGSVCPGLEQNTGEIYTAYDAVRAVDHWDFTVNTMSKKRRHLDSVLLPDGKVAVTGGEEVTCRTDSDCTGADGLCRPIYEAELFNPTTLTWSQVPPPPEPQRRPRQYHSTALLLPDGSVLLTGGESASPRCYPAASVQVYKPGYFWRGPRPVIQSAPAVMQYNPDGTRRFPIQVTLPQGDDISQIQKVVLIRPGSVTHSFNMDQRALELYITDASGSNCHLASSNCTVTVSTPYGPDIAPRGYYMLFVVKGTGDSQIPSVAKFVQILP